MKATQIILISLLIFAAALSSCKKDKDTDPGNKPPVENLPPDDDPVTGTISGVIAEASFDELQAQSSVGINRIPHTLPKFLELRNQIAHTPQGAAMMILVAMRIYQQYPVEGMKCLTAACTSPLIVPSGEAGNFEGYVMGNVAELTRKLKDLSYLPFVYYQGASPANQYTPAAPPYTSVMQVNQYSYMSSTDGSTRIKVFIQTLGADSPRPVVVRKTGDHYRVTEYSSLYLAPKPPLN
ncbi:hypothetical protein SDC9_30786 [bioreactor metagenome]|jgi:hypothetical protein|uniref:DUF6935 domain-containing protein n=1 Tax=bioreactor metagenome TaxID=1076179 RepID=A0A644V0Y0_9ZZZZ|nr:hypothetical protein [Lentimicrobium sp.]MEA5110202.1 hypothetical protein [Lentimicrobium sp.]